MSCSLQNEIARAREAVRQLEDESSEDLALGREQLAEQRKRQEARAHASFARCQQSAALLYAHECAQAEARYAARCEQLQREMSAELQREIQRLKNARDGVSVMDRRRLARHPKNKRGKGGAAGSRGNGGGADFSDGGGLDLLHPSEVLSPAEETYRQQQEEKKRLEALLSKAPVFKPLTHHVAREEATSDLNAIVRVVAARSGASRSRIDNRRYRVAFPRFDSRAQSSSSDSDDDDDEVDSDEDGDDDEEKAGGERPALASGRRLACNPGMLQEGDEVVVHFRRKRVRDDSDSDAAAEARSEERRVLSGVITASTASIVFLLCADGTFETLDVGDWKAGRIRVHARKRRREH